MKKILLTATVVVCFTAVKAQFTTDYLRAADNYYKKGDFYSATLYYEKYLNTGKANSSTEGFKPYTVQPATKKEQARVSSQQQAIYNLAESYRQLNYYVKAEPVYKQVVDWNNAQFP